KVDIRKQRPRPIIPAAHPNSLEITCKMESCVQPKSQWVFQQPVRLTARQKDRSGRWRRVAMGGLKAAVRELPA
ncbi:hypothetical protein, partial [Rhizobium sp. NZLR11]|uniref:hypothetical protein n=1 Tax=Rhizobium sp. NZLR11 TaxID=2731098 RepID=UPI001C82AC4C